MKEKNLTSFMQKLIVSFLQEGRLGTAHVYQSTYNRIKSFTGGRPLKFNELTPSWLKAFQNYLLSYQLQWNTISTYMRMLRAVYFRAVDEGITIEYPRLFHCVYTGTRVTVKRAVDAQVLQHLYNKQIPQNTKNGKSTKTLSTTFYATRNSFCRYCVPETMRFERQHPYLPTPKNRDMDYSTCRT